MPQTQLSARPKLTPICFRQPLCVQCLTRRKEALLCANPLSQHPTFSLSSSQPHHSPLKTTFFSYSSMTDQPVSSHLRTLFQLALEDYEIKTEISLANYPLAQKLQNCNSVESITTILQDQARSFDEFRGRDRIMDSIRSTVSLLEKLSATASLSDSIGQVHHKAPMTVLCL